MAFEEKFGVSIPDEDASQLSTPRKVTDYIMSKVEDKGMTREQVAALVRPVIEDQTAIHDFSDDDDFTLDLNLDRICWRH